MIVILHLIAYPVRTEWGKVLGCPQYQVLRSTLTCSLQEAVACKQLECGSRAVTIATPWLPPQPIASACGPSYGHFRALAMLCVWHQFSFHPRTTSGCERWGCLSSEATCLSTCLHPATARKIQLLLATINSPIILAIDLTDFINPAHGQPLPLSTLIIIWNRIPVE